MKAYQSLNKQRGLTLVETLVAVVVGLIILAGAFVVFGMITSSNKLSNAEQDLTTTQLNIKQLYQGQPNYTGLSNAVAFAANVFPQDMATSAINVIDQWNGAVTLAADANPTEFDITFAGVPQDACIKFASFEFGQWVSLTINGTNIPQTQGTSPVTVAATACVAGPNNAVVWVSG